MENFNPMPGYVLAKQIDEDTVQGGIVISASGKSDPEALTLYKAHKVHPQYEGKDGQLQNTPFMSGVKILAKKRDALVCHQGTEQWYWIAIQNIVAYQ